MPVQYGCRRCGDGVEIYSFPAHSVIFYRYLAATSVTIRQLIQRARTRYRWDPCPHQTT